MTQTIDTVTKTVRTLANAVTNGITQVATTGSNLVMVSEKYSSMAAKHAKIREMEFDHLCKQKAAMRVAIAMQELADSKVDAELLKQATELFANL